MPGTPTNTREIKIDLRAFVTYQIEGEYLRIKTKVKSASGLEFEEPQGTLLPLNLFNDTTGQIDYELIEKYCEGVDLVVSKTVDEALFRDVALHINQTAQLAGIRTGIIKASYEEMFEVLAKYHTFVTTAKLRSMMGYQAEGNGRHAKWTKDQLYKAIVKTMQNVKEPCRTYPVIAKRLATTWSDRFTGGTSALKKLVTRYDLKWGDLKKAAASVDAASLEPSAQDQPQNPNHDQAV